MKIKGTALALLMSLCIFAALAQDSSMQEGMDEEKRIPEGTIVGEVAPDFTVRDLFGKTFKSKESLRTGPVVLVFFQGSWNGEDVEFLINLNDSISVLQGLNAQVLAVSTEQAEFTKMLLKKGDIGYILAQDHAGRLSKAFDVIYYVEEKFCMEMMQKGNINLHERYNSEAVAMSAPAVVVISQNGKIVFSQMDFASGNRPYVSQLAQSITSPAEQRSEEPMLEETGGEPVKEKRRRKKKEKN